ncbi:GntR family transcriptional regulator [Cohnella fermenti]|uniref:GntR family transcriptional regulator n=1 Tax=Cohnella fermenti TaxID=2565925 RepID=A0A4S4C0C6_9BACL|nr:GntR family transcriptional regulator [Cohnella fermenti]THF80382.1 GntR family transcriptional regulator [Cohnella fermenti]
MKSVPLYKKIQNHLREQILTGALRPGDRVPSEKEIADFFNVSQITSKQALAGLADQDLVVRIKGKGTFVAGRMGTDILKSIDSGFKGIVGIVFPSICMPVESLLFYHIQSLLHDRGYQTLIRVTEDKMDKEIEAIRMFQMFGVRGFIIFPVINESYNEEILKLTLNRFPHVLVDRYLPNISNSSVTSENEAGMTAVAEYLFEARHKDIALITQEDTNSNTRERMIGFEKAYVDRKLPVDKQYWLFLRRDGKEQDAELCSRIRSFLENCPHVTAVVTVDTVLARLAYAVLHEMGRKVPNDVLLASFDDPKLPFVPFVEQDIGTISQKAVDLIIRQMEQGYFVARESVPVRFVDGVRYPMPDGI